MLILDTMLLHFHFPENSWVALKLLSTNETVSPRNFQVWSKVTPASVPTCIQIISHHTLDESQLAPHIPATEADCVQSNDRRRPPLPADKSDSLTLAVKFCGIKLASLNLAQVAEMS